MPLSDVCVSTADVTARVVLSSDRLACAKEKAPRNLLRFSVSGIYQSDIRNLSDQP